MDHLVFVDAGAGELEKILSGLKTMIIKDCDPAQSPVQPVSPGDNLYFLRDNGESCLRVKAGVVRILPFWKSEGEDLSQVLKELQARLQLTEGQYHYWSAKEVVLFVEFDSARKIPVIEVALQWIKGRSGWIAFEEFNGIT